MRYWPRSLSGSVLALLLVGAGATGLMSSQWQGQAQLHPLARQTVETRLQALWQWLMTQPLDVDVTLTALSVPEVQWSRQPASTIDPAHMDAQERTLASTIGQRLGLPADAPVRVRLRMLAGEEDAVAKFHDLSPSPTSGRGTQQQAFATASITGRGELPENDPVDPWVLQVELPLPDGRWLYSQHRATLMHPHWDRVLRFALPLMAVSIILVVLLFSHRIVRPLKALALAVGRISRGEPPHPLPLQGPRSVREITAAFNDMHQRLDRFIQDRTRMIAAISHDLRTPLASLRIRAELIDDERLRHDIIHTLNDMAVMAEETLAFARDDATREPVQAVDVVALVDDVVAVQRGLGHVIEWAAPERPHFCHCRPVQLKRALGILLDNALRYGNGWVEVAMTAGVDAIQIDIHDNGPGIPEDQLERVFEPFVRLDAARSLDAGGVGLGLAIARSCIRGHGGELHLQPRSEGGLRAVVMVPV